MRRGSLAGGTRLGGGAGGGDEDEQRRVRRRCRVKGRGSDRTVDRVGGWSFVGAEWLRTSQKGQSI
jgi:hypothetical protein